MVYLCVIRYIVKGEAVHLSLTEKPAVTGDKLGTPAVSPHHNPFSSFLQLFLDAVATY